MMTWSSPEIHPDLVETSDISPDPARTVLAIVIAALTLLTSLHARAFRRATPETVRTRRATRTAACECVESA